MDRGLVRAQVADVFLVLQLVLAIFAAAIAVGVVYNNARIALEIRSRDLATLRILGFTRGELAFVLLGEQADPGRPRARARALPRPVDRRAFALARSTGSSSGSRSAVSPDVVCQPPRASSCSPRSLSALLVRAPVGPARPRSPSSRLATEVEP